MHTSYLCPGSAEFILSQFLQFRFQFRIMLKAMNKFGFHLYVFTLTSCRYVKSQMVLNSTITFMHQHRILHHQAFQLQAFHLL